MPALKTKQNIKHENEVKTAKDWKQVGFEKGDVSKVCFKETRKHQQRKSQKNKDWRNKNNNNVFQKGFMDKKQRKKWNFEKEDKRKTRTKTEQEEEKDFKHRPFGKTKRKNLENCRKIAFWGFSNKAEQKQWENKTKHQKQKNKPKTNTFLHVGKQPPILVNFCFISTYTL